MIDTGLQTVRHAISRDPTRYGLSSVLVRRGLAIASDGHRLALATTALPDGAYSGDGQTSDIAPSEHTLTQEAVDGALALAGNGATFAVQRLALARDVTATAKAVEAAGEHEEHERKARLRIARTERHATKGKAKRKALDETIKQLLNAKPGPTSVWLNPREGSLAPSTVRWEGGVRLCARYLVEALRAMRGEMVTVRMGDVMSAIEIKHEIGIEIVMPVRPE